MKSIVMTQGYSDSELTAGALAGQRDAFAQIVTRYQSLVCSLAYSATGSLSQSEDLAQETFIAAWKGLRTLREPERLRSWLCSIARNIIANTVRQKKQEPSLTAEPLDAAQDHASQELLPVDRAISSEEESILWRSLEHIPEAYREPLVLFYREGQSIESVAEKLELSEEAVKQRLSRGRKLLKMEVAAFVESALGRSTPGGGFTAAVLAGLPELAVPTGASSVAAVLSKSSAIAKSGFIAGMLTPILGALGGFVSLVGFVKSAQSTRERALSIKWAVIFISVFVVQVAGVLSQPRRFFVPIFLATFFAQIFICLIWGIKVHRLRKRIRIEENTSERPDAKLPFCRPGSKGFKWNVTGGLLGLVFANPLTFLAVMAAKAHDSAALFVVLVVLFTTFIISYQRILRRPEKAWSVVRVIPIAFFPLLLIGVQLRWETWTGQPSWWRSGEALFPVAIGFLLFAFFAIVWWIKRNRGD
jgi:RNA polymerase sigma factor (sigma-70 family)